MIHFLEFFKPKIKNNINILWVGIFLFLLAVSNSWFNIMASNPEFVKSYFAAFGTAFLMIIALYYKCQKPDINLKIGFLKLSLILIFIFGTLSIFWSLNFDITLGKWLLWAIATFSFIISMNLSTSPENLIKLSWGLTIAACAIAIIGLVQHYSDPFAFPQSPPSTFGNKNIAVQVLVLIFPMSIFLIFSKFVQGFKVWILLGLISLIITYIVLSFTRGAWLSIFIEFFCISTYFLLRKSTIFQWIDWNKNKRNATLLSIILIIMLVNLSPPDNLNNISNDILQRVSLTGSTVDHATLYRLEGWKIGIEMFFDAPFIGTGLGSYAQNLGNEGYASPTINNFMHAHNDLIELAVELGIIGLMFFIMVVLSIIMGVIKILKQTTGELHLFFFFLLISLLGSFINLQFSFPYQMTVPLVLFGLYSGLIAKQIDKISKPLIKLSFLLRTMYKKIILLMFSLCIFTVFFFTYFQWIIFYDQLNKFSSLGDFSQLEVIEIPLQENNIQSTLYSLGGIYFNKGGYIQSKMIDKKFLELWPNHLDVLFRQAYAEHKIGQNSIAIDLAKKLKKIEPEGLYNAFIVEMFVYLSTNDIIEFEQTFNELLLQPEEFLGLNESTYRMMIFFTLSSKKLSKYAPSLYSKYMENSIYFEYKDDVYYDRICEIENNMAIHYFNLEDYINSVKHVNKIPVKLQSCFNTELIVLLREMTLD